MKGVITEDEKAISSNNIRTKNTRRGISQYLRFNNANFIN